MTFEALVEMMKQYMATINVTGNHNQAICNFHVNGAVEGDFYVILKDEKLTLDIGKHPNNDLTISCGSDSIMKIILGGNVLADFMLGKIKFSGSMDKAMVLKNLLGL